MSVTVASVHELSVARELAGVVRRAAAGRRVLAVQVRIGYLRQVVPDALDSAWRFTTRGTALEGAVLEMTEVPVLLTCSDCGATLPPPAPLVFDCAACASAATRVSAGEELLVESIDVGT